MRVVLEVAALDDLDGIHAWIARDNADAANSTVGRIYDEIEHLGRLPHLGHQGRARGTLEWVVTSSSHVVVYTTDEERDELTVAGVFQGSQQFRRP